MAEIIVSGLENPYLINFNQMGYSSNSIYTSLAPGNYYISIKNKNTCEYDTAFEIKPYAKVPFAFSLEKNDPTCKKLNGGSITLTIQGLQSPYLISYNNNIYANGAPIDNLSKGVHRLLIVNNENCVIDTIYETLDLELTPDCSNVFVPKAFTPNVDGLNDIFRPFVGEGITEMEFSIFNRWGQKVFSTTEKGKGWDGNLNGSNQSSGVYVWILRYKTINNPQEKILKGNMTLIR
jgi:gliding motility-associated-like protein